MKSLCVILRSTDYKDYDKMLTLFSKDTGRIDALARGAKKPGSIFSAASQPFTCGEYLFYQKNERYFLNQVDIKNSFYRLRQDIEDYSTAVFAAEIIGKVITERQDYARLFSLFVNLLHGHHQTGHGGMRTRGRS